MENIYEQIELQPTVKGGNYLIFNGNRFVQHKKNQVTETSYFRCTQYKASK